MDIRIHQQEPRNLHDLRFDMEVRLPIYDRQGIDVGVLTIPVEELTEAVAWGYAKSLEPYEGA